MGHRPLLVAMMLVACAACSSHGPVDDGGVAFDAAVDLPRGDLLPEVMPQGPRCAEVTAPAGTRCIPAGFFWLAYTTEKQMPRYPDNKPAYLDAYLLDVHEVTVRAYADHVKSSGATPLPEVCGFSSPKNCDAHPTAYGYVQDRSGWTSGGEPDAARLDHPVVCVTRSEAMAYCAAKGGRLPSIAELMKAGRGPLPDLRRFPWGDEPPALDDKLCPDCQAGFAWVVMYEPCDDDQLHTKPAGALPLGESPFGIRALAGNVSEFVLDCHSEFHSAWSGQRVIVRPRPTGTSSTPCGAGVFGLNWRSQGYPYLLFEWFFGPRQVHSLILSYFKANDDNATHPLDGSTIRSWRVGFRCAYDLAP